MTNLFNPETAITTIWGMIENIAVAEDQLAVAGGAIADNKYNVGTKDIDVFASVTILERVRKFCDYYKFKEMFKHGEDLVITTSERSYSELIKNRVSSGVVTVFKGFLLGYPVDIVVVDSGSVSNHIFNRFDMSIKAGLYDGEFRYSDAFMKTVETGKITPLRFDPTGYVRAYHAAEKYGLEVGPEYNLSRAFSYEAYKNEMLDEFTRAATMERFSPDMFDAFDFTSAEKANSALVSLLMEYSVAEGTHEEMYKKFQSIADKDVVADHGLHGKEFDITVAPASYKEFMKLVKKAYQMTKSNRHIPAVQEAANDILLFKAVTPSEYVQGVMKDSSERSVRIGKFFSKIMRKHKDVIGQSMTKLEMAKQIFDTREAAESAKFFITGNKYALTHISTHTKWTSCQQILGFRSHKKQNYGLLANVSGATLVGYFADKRSDKKTSNWHGRVLLRVGKKNEIVIENIYTNRTELNSEAIRKSIQSALKEAGWDAFTNEQEARHFKGLDLWSKPYGDCSAVEIKATKSGRFYLRGKHERLLKLEESAAIGQLMSARLTEAMPAILENGPGAMKFKLSEELTVRIAAYEKKHGSAWNIYVNQTEAHSIPETDTHHFGMNASIEKICDGLFVLTTHVYAYEKSPKGINHAPVSGYGYPVAQRVPVMPVGQAVFQVGADLDGDDPFGFDELEVDGDDRNDDLPF